MDCFVADAPRKKRIDGLELEQVRRPPRLVEVDGEAELLEASDQSAGFDLDRASIEVAGPEVVVFGAVLENVIDCREERCGDGTDGLLRSAPTLQVEELGSVVTVFFARGSPGALDELGANLCDSNRSVLGGHHGFVARTRSIASARS